MHIYNIYDFENGYTGLENQYLITPLDMSLVQYERTLCPLLERGQKIDFLAPYIAKNYNIHQALSISSSSSEDVTTTGTPPLTFKAKESTPLTDYTISGNTGEQNILVNKFRQGEIWIGCGTEAVTTTTMQWFPIKQGQTYTVGMSSEAYNTIYRYTLCTTQNPYITISSDFARSYCTGYTWGRKADYTFTATNNGWGCIVIDNDSHSGSITPEIAEGLGVFVKTNGAVGDLVPNIFKLTGSSTTRSGVTVTVNSDMSVKLQGTPTSSDSTSHVSGFYMPLFENAFRYYGRWRINCQFTGTSTASTSVAYVKDTNSDSTREAWICQLQADGTMTKTYRKGTSGSWSEVDEVIVDVDGADYSSYPRYSGLRFTWGGTGTMDVTVKVTITPILDDDRTLLPGTYAVPITLNDATHTIYLDSMLTKTGDAADRLNYLTQKRYNADGTESTLPYGIPELTVSSGTNTLSVGTSVQPESVSVTGKIENK